MSPQGPSSPPDLPCLVEKKKSGAGRGAARGAEPEQRRVRASVQEGTVWGAGCQKKPGGRLGRRKVWAKVHKVATANQAGRVERQSRQRRADAGH